MNNTTVHKTVLALLSVLTLVPGRISAQAAKSDPTAATGRSTSEEETIVLSPFEVTTSKDKGYKATNSTSGTRLNTEIKDVPLNLEVITNEFIRDTGGTNLREALRYSAGVVLESQSDAFVEADLDPQSSGANDPRGVTRTAGDSTVKLRGFVIEQVLRDGFRRQYSADSVNIERVEVLRGPSALLYGVGSFGGVINFIPKRPQLKASNYISATIGTANLYRGEIDFTGPMGDGPWKPAYRITGSYQDRGDYTQFYHERHWTIDPTFSFRPFKNTTVLIDNEFGRSTQTGNGFQNIRANLGNQAASPSRQAAWLTDGSGRVDNRTFRWSGGDTYLKGPFRNNVIDVTQKIGDDIFLKAGFASSQATFDSRTVSAGAAPTQFSISDPSKYYSTANVTLGGNTVNLAAAMAAANADPSGKYLGLYSPQDIYNARSPGAYRGDVLYGTVMQNIFNTVASTNAPTVNNQAMLWYQWKDYNRVETRNQLRLEATWSHDFGKWGKQTVLAGSQYMGLKSVEDEFGPAYAYTNLTTKVPVSVPNVDRYNYKKPTDYSPFVYGRQGDGVKDVAMYQLYNYLKKTWDLGYYAVYQGQFFNDHLTFIAGERWDRSDARQVQHYLYEKGHPDVLQGPGTPGTSGKAPTATSPQIGLSYRITRELSVFGLYSTGETPNPYAADGNGNILAPTKAKNKEVGLKFDLLEGKISGTISGYEITRTGAPKYIWWAPNPYKSLQQGWDKNKPNAVIGAYTTPEAMWRVIHLTEGKDVTQGLALAKKIWPAGWYPLLDELATTATQSAAYSGAQGSQFWGKLAGDAWVNTGNFDPNYKGNLWFPLINLSDPDVAKAFAAIKSNPGWDGNYYTDPGNTYRFGDGSTGFTNGPGASGAYVPMNDKARGWDASFIITPNDWIQIQLNFAHVDRKVTSKTYQFVSLSNWPAGWWMQQDANFGTYSPTRTPAQAYANVNDTATYRVTVPEYNNPVDDSPRNTASTWTRISLDHVLPMKGWAVGAGASWDDRRMWFSGFTGGGGNIALVNGVTDASDPNALVKLYTKRRYTVNTMIEYSTRLANRYDWRVALNVDNLLDDQGRYGLIYAPGRTMRLQSSIKF